MRGNDMKGSAKFCKHIQAMTCECDELHALICRWYRSFKEVETILNCKCKK